jgi:adenylate cyclase
MVLEYGGRYYMPMGLSLALAKLGADAGYVVGEEQVRIGSRRLPVTPRAEARLSFLGPNETFPRISAADLLGKRVAADAVQGKLVIIGYADVARDKVVTPFDTQLDGVEVHATLAHNILHDELMQHASPNTTLYTLLVLGLVLTLVQLRRVRQNREWAVGVAAVLMLGGYLVAAQLLFSRAGLVIEVAAPLGAGLLVALVSMTTALATEGRDRRALRAAFSQYVSETLVDRIANDINKTELTLGGVRRELTVLFSDIRGFSRFSEKLEPEMLSQYLNEYLTPMTELVMKDAGLLDKYIGDAIMAVYGAPLEMTDHAQHACATALAMQRDLGPLNESWRARGLPEIAIGIGVNTGPMAVGNMGSEARFDYTVMGDAVNLGARLEALTKEYDVDILAGEATATSATGFVFRELDLVRVTGRESTARVYELVGAEGDVALSPEQLAAFGTALASYRARDWETAEAGFDAFLQQVPHDGPARIMRDRVRTLRQAPPPADWDGVYAQVAK